MDHIGGSQAHPGQDKKHIGVDIVGGIGGSSEPNAEPNPIKVAVKPSLRQLRGRHEEGWGNALCGGDASPRSKSVNSSREPSGSRTTREPNPEPNPESPAPPARGRGEGPHTAGCSVEESGTEGKRSGLVPE